MRTINWIVLHLATLVAVSGCLPYLYKEREPALIPGIDIDQSLDVAETELGDDSRKGFDVLTLWALRDQPITVEQASRINKMYLRHIDWIASKDTRAHKFGVWHLTWAVSNFYRFGDAEVKAALQPAYKDAALRVEVLDRKVATEHFEGKEIYSGPAHVLGRGFARKHLIVPGNEDYLQSYKQYTSKR